MEGFEGKLAGQIDLRQESDSASLVRTVLGTTLDNLLQLQVNHHSNICDSVSSACWQQRVLLCTAQVVQTQLQQQCNLFKQNLNDAQHQVEQYVKQKQKWEEELYVKVSVAVKSESLVSLDGSHVL